MARDQTDQRMILADKRIPSPADPPSAYPFPYPLVILPTNHPRIPTTNKRTCASSIRLFVTPFVDGTGENKGGQHGS